MLSQADAGILFCPPDNVIKEFPEVADRLQKKFDGWASELPPPQWGWQPAYCGKIRIDPKSPDKDW